MRSFTEGPARRSVPPEDGDSRVPRARRCGERAAPRGPPGSGPGGKGGGSSQRGRAALPCPALPGADSGRSTGRYLHARRPRVHAGVEHGQQHPPAVEVGEAGEKGGGAGLLLGQEAVEGERLLGGGRHHARAGPGRAALRRGGGAGTCACAPLRGRGDSAARGCACCRLVVNKGDVEMLCVLRLFIYLFIPSFPISSYPPPLTTRSAK